MQFVGGDAAEDAIPVLERLRAENKGVLFVYSVEVDEAEAAGTSKAARTDETATHKRIVHETLHCLDVASAFEKKHASSHADRGTWVAIKLASIAFQQRGCMVRRAHIQRRVPWYRTQSH